MKPKPLLFWPREELLEAMPVAPWVPTPLKSVREYIREDPSAQIEIGFPEVFDEDRTAKITDLGTANELKVITHKRMAEAIAKELDFEQYDYAEEMEEIEKEQDNPLLKPPELGSGDALADSLFGGSSPGAQPARERPTLPALPEGTRTHLAAPAQPKRAQLSGDNTAKFRRQQRT
jgi:hypothetical protein